MSVRQRRWSNGQGGISIAWIADWRDRDGKRKIMTFAHKRDAADFHKVVRDKVLAKERANAIAMKFARQLSISRLRKIIAEKRRKENQT